MLARFLPPPPSTLVLAALVAIFTLHLLPMPAAAVVVPPALRQRMAGAPQEMLVLLDDDDDATSSAPHDAASADKATPRPNSAKNRVMSAFGEGDGELITDYSRLPMLFARVSSEAALERILAVPGVLAVYENRTIRPHLSQSLPLISQTILPSIGATGSGSTVAVIDTGVNYTHAAFGSCTAPGVPAGCKVAVSQDIAASDGVPDDIGHGTNVAGIVVGVAPGARIAALDVFNPDGSSNDALLISAINWAISNRANYNIVAMNLSLGDGSHNTAPCDNKFTNPYWTPIRNAKNAGIVTVISAGNEGYTDGVSRPACTSDAVSVGAVYDSNVGGVAWSVCTDTVTAADKVACLSDTAPFLDILAPGAFISAAGYSMGGTSQAAPHVAGGVAILKAKYPAETPDQIVSRLTSSGKPVTDQRTGGVFPRLDLLAAQGPPANDGFAAAATLSGHAGNLAATNANATKESGEPFHASNGGGKSVWWQWTATETGRMDISTAGSGFDTLLAVYTGTSVGGLNQIAANDNDGGLQTSRVSFTAAAGTTYRVAVDGFNGASGLVNIDWNFVKEADLALEVIDSTDPLYPGDQAVYAMTVTNNGPSNAADTYVSCVLPPELSFVSALPGCEYAGGTVTCALGAISPSAIAAAMLTASPATEGTFHVLCSVSASTADPFTGNDTTNVQSVVLSPPQPVPALSPWGMCAATLFFCGTLSTRRRL